MRIQVTGLLLAAAAFLTGSLYAGGVMEQANWFAVTGGNNITPAEVTTENSPFGPAIQAKVVEAAQYQGLNVHLPEPVVLENVKALTFKIHQTAYGKYPCHGCIHFNYGASGKGVMTAFVMETPVNGWSTVTLVPELDKLQSLRRSEPVAWGTVTALEFTIYGALSKPGQIMAIADLQFQMK